MRIVSVILSLAISLPAAAGEGSIERFDPRADTVIGPAATLERLTDDVFGWSEGPVWMEDRQELLFTDVPGNTLYGWREEGGLRVVQQPSGLEGDIPDGVREAGANGLIADGPDAILMGDQGNRVVARLDLRTGEKTVLADVFEGRKFNSPNDLVRTEDGTLYFTDPPYGLEEGDASPMKEMEVNGVYRLATDGSVSLVDDTLTRPNGVALSPDERTLYVAQSDPDAPFLFAYDLSGDGEASNRRVLADFSGDVDRGEKGLPDGLAVTAEGEIFVAGPGGVHLLSADGDRLALIRTGVPTANAALTPDESTLYITSGAFLSRVVLKEEGADRP